MTEALERTVEAGQSLFAGRLELIIAEARMLVRDGGLSLLVGALGLAGWVYLMRGVTGGLSQHIPRFSVELALGLAHVAVAMILLRRVRAR